MYNFCSPLFVVSCNVSKHFFKQTIDIFNLFKADYVEYSSGFLYIVQYFHSCSRNNTFPATTYGDQTEPTTTNIRIMHQKDDNIWVCLQKQPHH